MADPTAKEVRKKCPTFAGPTTFTSRIQCSALLMLHPHWLQSGLPPKTQGSTLVFRSAE